jgi:predicted metal-binding membrane protein
MSATAQRATNARGEQGIIVVLLLLTLVTWAGSVVVARRMGVMAGTMGLAVPAFLLVWLLMMAAMMLPAVSPVARLYLRTIGPQRRTRRVIGFLSGYLLVWTAAGLPAYGLAWGAQRLATQNAAAARLTAAATFIAVAAYQVSPLKDVCLKA